MSGGREVARQRAQGGGQVEQQGGGTVRGLFEQMKPEIQRALPRHMDADRMVRVALTVVQQNPALEQCDPRTLLGALMTCTQVGLEPGPQGHVYLVPYGRKVTFIMGYQGMIELARRSGLLVSIAAHTVYANEVAGINGGQFSVSYGTENKLTHKPIVFGERGDPVGYYAAAKIKSPSGNTTEDVFVVLTHGDVDAFRARSATQKADRPSGPWATDFEAMAWKTCVRRLARWLPQSPELAAALDREETVRDDVKGNVVDSAQQVPAEPFEAPRALPISDPSEVPAQAPQQESLAAPAAEGDPWAGAPEPGDADDPWSGPR